MNVRVAALTIAMLVLMPASAAVAQRLGRWWHGALLIVASAFVSGWLLLKELAVENSIETEAFNRIANPTIEQLRAFNTDTGVAGVAIFLGVPIFLLYGALCCGLLWGSRQIWKRLVHV